MLFLHTFQFLSVIIILCIIVTLFFIFGKDCDYSLGVAGGGVSPITLTSSTEMSNTNAASTAILGLIPDVGVTGTGWRPTERDSNPWLQLTMDEVYFVSAIVTQGCGNGKFWVKEFCLSYARDGIEQEYYTSSNVSEECQVIIVYSV